jgi:hypothetical protein
MNIVQDEDAIAAVILKELSRVSSSSNNPELALPRIQRHQLTVDSFLRAYNDRWRKEKYNSDDYDGSVGSVEIFLGFLKIIVGGAVADLAKNSFWDIFLLGPKEFWIRTI